MCYLFLIIFRAQSLRRQRFRERKKRNSKKAASLEPEARSEEERPEQNPQWFEKLVSTLAVLRHLVRNESSGKSVALDALGTSLVFPSTAWDRIIVITNIPSSISVDVITEGSWNRFSHVKRRVFAIHSNQKFSSGN